MSTSTSTNWGLFQYMSHKGTMVTISNLGSNAATDWERRRRIGGSGSDYPLLRRHAYSRGQRDVGVRALYIIKQMLRNKSVNLCFLFFVQYIHFSIGLHHPPPPHFQHWNGWKFSTALHAFWFVILVPPDPFTSPPPHATPTQPQPSPPPLTPNPAPTPPPPLFFF